MDEVRQGSTSTYGSSVRTAANTQSTVTEVKQSKQFFSNMLKGSGSVTSSMISSVQGDGEVDVSDTGDSFSMSDRYTTPSKSIVRDTGFLRRFSSTGPTGPTESGSRLRPRSVGWNGPVPGVNAVKGKGWSHRSEVSVSSRMSDVNYNQSNLAQDNKYLQWQRQGYDNIDTPSERQRSVLSELNKEDSPIQMTGNTYSAALKKLQNETKDRQKENIQNRITENQTKNTEFSTDNYLPRVREQFCSEQSFGQLSMLVSRNTSSVVACYNRNGERNSGAKNVLKEIIEKERMSSDEYVENENKNLKHFRQRLKITGKCLFESLTLLFFTSPIFTSISLTSFFFFIFSEPLFFTLSILIFVFYHYFVFSSKS